LEGPVLGPRDIIRRAADRIDRAVFPEATSAGDQWQRVVMNKAIDDHIAALGPTTRSAVEISGDSHAERPWRKYASLNYPKYDICDRSIAEQGPFDVVICEQVLEHVVDPWGAAGNLRRLTRPGGHLIVSTPFLIKIHEVALFLMDDYWRFTPRGLRTLLEGAGLAVDTVATWGNAPCVIGNLRRWSSYRRWHPLHDEPDLAVQVWAFARNPGEQARAETREHG
jgi:SAM-dependent methyltransferase